MKANYSLLIISLFVLNSFTGFSQENGVSYKFSKITLSTGEVIKPKNITLYSDNVSYKVYNESAKMKMDVSHDLNRIQKIEVSTKNNLLPGLFIGSGAGIVATIIVQKIVERPRSETTTTSGPGYTQTETRVTTKRLGLQYKMAIFSGSTLLGILIGSSIKKGWKTVFPQSSSMLDQFDINVSLSPVNRNTSGLSLGYRF
jgi:hypothetical protein